MEVRKQTHLGELVQSVLMVVLRSGLIHTVCSWDCNARGRGMNGTP